MTPVEILARLDGKMRPLMANLPPQLVSKIYSNSRALFLKSFTKDSFKSDFTPPEKFLKTLWGINFRAPLFNSAGVFKNGTGYEVVAAQGAGAYLAGTTTAIPRNGNIKNGIRHPFMPYPRSGAASNWMGLPNEGHDAVAARLLKIKKVDGCPVGASLSSAPELKDEEALETLVAGFKSYERANVDFLELNESCPNVAGHEKHDDSGLDPALIERLKYVSENFLKTRSRNLPLIVKFSNDTAHEQIPALLKILIELNFDGVNFGNTSTNYAEHRAKFAASETKMLDYFIKEFGGGLSGRILKTDSLKLATIAVEFLKSEKPAHEFHVIRTGGIETAKDLLASEKAGISLNQWYTGYFEGFSKYGHEVYKEVLKF
jgi:dihydroorotate dehydrogenase